MFIENKYYDIDNTSITSINPTSNYKIKILLNNSYIYFDIISHSPSTNYIEINVKFILSVLNHEILPEELSNKDNIFQENGKRIRRRENKQEQTKKNSFILLCFPLWERIAIKMKRKKRENY